MRLRRFPVSKLPEVGGTVRLDATASHHLLHVCRQLRGARLIVFDGSGQQAEAELTGIQEGHAALRVIGVPQHAAPAHPLHLVLGIPKGPALETAIRMAVEAGVTHIHPALSTRSVKRSDRSDRWRRILEGAAQQCGRADIPELLPLMSLPRCAQSIPTDLDRRVAIPGAPHAERATGGAAVAIGPEGGFTATEVDRLVASGWAPVGLGAWALRTDTAVAVALAATVPE